MHQIKLSHLVFLDYLRLFNVGFLYLGAPENLSAPTTHITLVDDDVELDEDDGDMEVSDYIMTNCNSICHPSCKEGDL